MSDHPATDRPFNAKEGKTKIPLSVFAQSYPRRLENRPKKVEQTSFSPWRKSFNDPRLWPLFAQGKEEDFCSLTSQFGFSPPDCCCHHWSWCWFTPAKPIVESAGSAAELDLFEVDDDDEESDPGGEGSCWGRGWRNSDIWIGGSW